MINKLREDFRFDLVALSQDYHPPKHVSFADTHNEPLFSVKDLGNGKEQVSTIAI